MRANEVAVHEVDGRRMHMVLDGLADGAAALGVEPDATGRLSPLRSPAYRRAVALLSIYRSRVDFLEQREIDGSSESLKRPGPIGPGPLAVH